VRVHTRAPRFSGAVIELDEKTGAFMAKLVGGNDVPLRRLYRSQVHKSDKIIYDASFSVMIPKELTTLEMLKSINLCRAGPSNKKEEKKEKSDNHLPWRGAGAQKDGFFGTSSFVLLFVRHRFGFPVTAVPKSSLPIFQCSVVFQGNGSFLPRG
jgi:hypothetical protein